MLEEKFRFLPQKIFIDPTSAIMLRMCRFINPNIITLLAGVSGCLVAFCLVFKAKWLALVCLWLSGYFDMLDGTIARKQNISSDIGAVYDIIVDRVVEFAVILGLFLAWPAREFYIILMLGSILLCVTSFLVVGIMTENNSEKGFYYSRGLMERAEAFIFFSIMILLPEYFVISSLVFTLLVLYTAIVRVLEFVRIHQVS